jgi:putative DNA primase/helicase
MMGEAASYYAAELRWRVFPVAPNGRSPMIKEGCHGASNDPTQIEAWWKRAPQANLALACGPASGVLALDVDSKGDVDGFAALASLEREFERLPHTVESRTPSGGKHRLFAYPGDLHPQNRVGVKRWNTHGERRDYPGLDVRGRDGSVCLPPSSKPNGPYVWVAAPWDQVLAPVPAWLLALMLSEPPPRPKAELRSIATPDRVARYVCAAIEGECREVASMKPNTGRNHRLFVASAKLGELVGAGVLAIELAETALERAASDCGLIAEDGLRAIQATIRSGLTRGVQNPREVTA